MRFLAFVMVALAGLALAGCDPTQPNTKVVATSTTLHALCGTAQFVLPAAYAYIPKTEAWLDKYAKAKESVRLYCAGPISTTVAEAFGNLTVALSPFLPIVVQTPALLTLAKRTPGWKLVEGWQSLR